jgi:hypothetical protein
LYYLQRECVCFIICRRRAKENIVYIYLFFNRLYEKPPFNLPAMGTSYTTSNTSYAV